MTFKMQSFLTVKCVTVALCLLIVAAEFVTSAPSYSDYESVRDLYELLLQKEAMENRMQQQGQHEIGSPYSEHSSVESSVGEN
ncbi:hypothetical protein C0J52_02828 [Blattella germanica]|nr:hypothetical protein C0J52_02828 [Blattella germanica]